MLEIASCDGPKPKCYFTHAHLSSFVDHDQPPTKKRPFSTILSQTTSHTIDIVFPEHSLPKFKDALGEGKGTLHYARVHMKPSDIIGGEFFNHYIKSGGNIIMLSEGRLGIDHTYSLAEGMLRLEVDKATYERMGLEGKAIPSEGRKYVKARYAVDINLRLPSMVRGKPGYERIVWAFKNVLNRSVTWLFCDLEAQIDGTGPISVHQPIVRSVEPCIEQLNHVVVPAFPETLDQDDQPKTSELLEWLTMIAMLSPRTQHNDDIDPYLSRYQVPAATTMGGKGSNIDIQSVARIRWHGFMPATFISRLFLITLRACGDDWFSICATSFSGEAYAILKGGERTLTWEHID